MTAVVMRRDPSTEQGIVEAGAMKRGEHSSSALRVDVEGVVRVEARRWAGRGAFVA